MRRAAIQLTGQVGSGYPLLPTLQALRAQGVPFVQLNPSGVLHGSRRVVARYSTRQASTYNLLYLMVPADSVPLVQLVAKSEGVASHPVSLAALWGTHVAPRVVIGLPLAGARQRR